MLKVKKYFECIKYCKCKLLLLISITLIIISIVNNSFLIINSSKIIDSIGTDEIYKYLIISLGLFIISIVLSFVISQLKKLNFVKTKLSITNTFLINWLNLNMSKRNKYQTGEVNVMIEKDISEICGIATSSLLDLINFIISTLVNIILVGAINLYLLPIILFFTIINFLKIQKKLYKRKDIIEKKNNESLKDLNTCLLGMHERLDYLKIYNLYDWSKKEILEKLNDNYELREKENTLSTLSSRLTYLPGWICELLFYIIGGILVIKGNMSIGLLFASITFITKIMLATQNFNLKLSSIGISLNSYERVFSFISKNCEDELLEPCQDGRLIIKHLSFKYDSNPEVISNLNLNIPTKGVLLINGKNGSGKSTLINLLMGLEKPTCGEIKLNGIDSKNYTLDFIYENFSCAFQNGFLYNGSGIENIVFEKEYNADKVSTVLNYKVFSAINNLNVKANGDGLSGGEKKRVILARTLYKNFKILLLDEIDSGMDKQGVEDVFSIINDLKKDKLVIIISHYNMEKFKNLVDYRIDL